MSYDAANEKLKKEGESIRPLELEMNVKKRLRGAIPFVKNI